MAKRMIYENIQIVYEVKENSPIIEKLKDILIPNCKVLVAEKG